MSDSELLLNVETTRPTTEIIPPPVIKLERDGRDLRCYDVDAGHWRTMTAILIDYQAFHAWAPQMEYRLRLAHEDVARADQQSELLKTSLDAATRGMDFNRRLYVEEHEDNMQQLSRTTLAAYLLGGVALAEMVAIVGISIFAASK